MDSYCVIKVGMVPEGELIATTHPRPDSQH